MSNTPTSKIVQSDAPFTPEEDEVMEHLVRALTKFVSLPDQNKNAVAAFTKGIQDCQCRLSMRTMRKLFPDYFITED